MIWHFWHGGIFFFVHLVGPEYANQSRKLFHKFNFCDNTLLFLIAEPFIVCSNCQHVPFK